MQTSGIGIIGGADGPTAVFVTSNSIFPIAAIAVVLVLAVAACIFFIKK